MSWSPILREEGSEEDRMIRWVREGGREVIG